MTRTFSVIPQGRAALKRLFAYSGTAIILTFSSMVTAQSDAAEQSLDNWYQVELVVFKRNNGHQADNQETWPKNLALAYPPNVRYLQPETPEDSPPDTNNTLDVSPENADGTPPPREQPFTFLGNDAFFIKGADYALTREPGVTILFHHTWRQPMTALENSPALIIRGGDSFGEHKELEGTLTLSLSRYLHINTDLWLTEFEANYGQENRHWPNLPALPKPLSDFAQDDLSLDIEKGQFNTAGSLDLSNTQTGFDMQLSDGNNQSLTNQSDFLLNDFSQLTSQPYLIKQIATLRQKRRMRSDELHYIDHPKMGILIKIMPYSPEKKEAQAQ